MGEELVAAQTSVVPVEADLDARWDLERLLEERNVDQLLDEAQQLVDVLERDRGGVADFDPRALRDFMLDLAHVHELVVLAQTYAELHFAADTANPKWGALLQDVEERTAVTLGALLFFEVEWAALCEESVEVLLAAPELDFCRHHLVAARDRRNHLLGESEERLLMEKSVTGAQAWVRLYGELLGETAVQLPDGESSLDVALADLASPDPSVRRLSADAITDALAPRLRLRAYIFNTVAADHFLDDRLRGFPHWLAARNSANELSDQSVNALLSSVWQRNDLPQRWYRLKARLLGLDKLADHDRMASIAPSQEMVPFGEAVSTVIDVFDAFAPVFGEVARTFFSGPFVDAGLRIGKQRGAFCSYGVPSQHPYLMVNYTGRWRDVLTLAHELGHGIHAVLSAGQGIFHQAPPLPFGETASVFAEMLVLGHLLEPATDSLRLELLAETLDGAMATVFRPAAMTRFEGLVHTARRDDGELTVDRFGELWGQSQTEMLGDTMEVGDGFRTWWSLIGQLVAEPGYMYSYCYAHLLSLSLYRQLQKDPETFVPAYIEMLSAGGSYAPAELGGIVGCDVDDPGFWLDGLAVIEAQIRSAEKQMLAVQQASRFGGAGDPPPG